MRPTQKTMNILIQHIEYLLLRHDCVIVPGLGAFIATAVPAKIDLELGLLLPPSRRVMFNQAVTSDDGLLTNSIARRHSLSFEEARQTVFHAVSLLKNTVLTRNSCCIGKIGSLFLGEGNNLVFSPTENSDSIVAIPGLIALPFEKESEQIIDKFIPYDKISSSRKGLIKAGKIAAAVIAIVAVAIATLLYPLPTDKREQKASVIPIEIIFSSGAEKAGSSPVSVSAQHNEINFPDTLDSHSAEITR